MKRFLINYLIVLFSPALLATTFKVEDPCTGEVVVHENVEGETNVGALTIKALDKSGIDYIGAELGIHTMLGTPIGDEALEILSRKEMRAYGWCFHVDGFVPEALPPNVPTDEETKEVVWFFAFAHYLEGEWISQCEPVSLTKPEYICGELPKNY